MLNIGSSGSSNYVKFNGKSGRWYRPGEDGEIEVQSPVFVADLANVATGWLRFREGQAPERCMDPSLDRPAPSPGEGFRRGFVMAAYSSKYFGGVAEFSSASIHVGNAIRELYQLFEKERASHPGQLPVVACTGCEEMRDRRGSNFKPQMQIAKWVDRPAELPDASPVDPADIWQGETPATVKPQAAHVPPPSPKPAPAAAADPLLETEF